VYLDPNTTLWNRAVARSPLVPTTPSLSVASVTTGECHRCTAQTVVQLSNPTSAPVTANWSTVANSAVASSDFLAASGTVTIPAGATSVPISIDLVNENVYEGTETFRIAIDSVSGPATLGSPGTVTILDDEVRPTVSVQPRAVREGRNTKFFEVGLILSDVSSVPITVSWTTNDDTAWAGGDYTPVTGTATFAPGARRVLVAIQVIGDTIVEPDERLFVDVLPHEGSPTGFRGALILLNDD
jgi:Calx-beta domain